MPQFSIIIPVYNVQNHLAACLKSVAEQPGPRDWECLLIDDGSTDLTGSICDTLAAEIPGLQVLHQARWQACSRSCLLSPSCSLSWTFCR